MENLEYEFHSAFNDKYSLVARKIIRMLSKDSRATISEISKNAGIPRSQVKQRIERLEKEFGIRYVLELNERMLGFSSPHLIMAKFDKKPSKEYLKELLGKSYIPQYAALVSGDYDLLVYANASSSSDYALWDKGMQIALSEYGIQWRTSEVVHRQLGFFPLRNELLQRAALKEQEKAALLEINSNSRISANELAKKLGIAPSNIDYIVSKLEKDGIILSYTIAMNKPDWATIMTFFSKYMPKANYERHSMHARMAFMSDDQYPIIDRYVLTSPMIGSYDFFTIGVFDSKESAMVHDIQYHKALFKEDNIEMKIGTIEEQLIGTLPLRSVGTKESYKLITWNKLP
ncbi:MAG: winged helix-turn-helix transcriptional regulator [Candidatus Micrarchaeia archaeon]